MRPRPRLQAPRLRSSSEAGGSSAGPGAERSERVQGLAVSAHRDPLPGPARPPAAPREAGAGKGLALAWGEGPGAWGRGKRPLEGHGRRGAASGTQHCGCGEPGQAAVATAVATSETRRLPGALRLEAVRPLQPPWEAWSREPRERDPRFPRAAEREPLCGDPRGSAQAGAGVRAPG